jgi:hypothetical protein
MGRSIAEIVHSLVHAGNHVDLMDDADALVNDEKAPEKEDAADVEES